MSMCTGHVATRHFSAHLMLQNALEDTDDYKTNMETRRLVDETRLATKHRIPLPYILTVVL